MVIIEFDLGQFADDEWDIGTAGRTVHPIIFTPAAVDSCLITRSLFVIVVGGPDLKAALPDVTISIVGEHRVLTGGLPFPWATELILLRAGDVDGFRIGRILSLCSGSEKGCEGGEYGRADREE